MNKKLFILLAIIAITFSGCGKKVEVPAMTEAPVTTEVAATEATTEEETTEAPTTELPNPRNNIIIAIDPGHQGPNVDMSAKEPNAPGSSVMKTKATSGTTGRFTGVGEYQLNLDISLKLRDALEDLGYKIIMTREDNDTAISNAERATFANDNGADISIRIHANGSENSSQNGALTMTSSASNQYVGNCYEDSHRLAKAVIDEYCDATGMANLGITETDTMTGINWSKIPVIILEMGFMTNEQDDRNMQDSAYQEKMVEGIVAGVEDYYDFGDEKDGVSVKVKKIIKSGAKSIKGTTSVGFFSINEDSEYLYKSKPMIAASLIKLYIAGAVYEHYDEVQTQAASANETDTLLNKMISISDNDSANTLVRRLGNGDENKGMKVVNIFCKEHGFNDTEMNRLMLVNNGLENYTSVKDLISVLKAYYNNELPGSDEVISYMKAQERRTKLPAGIPDGVTVANKTGELANVENDAAIVFLNNSPYILCVMTEDVSDSYDAVEKLKTMSQHIYKQLT